MKKYEIILIISFISIIAFICILLSQMEVKVSLDPTWYSISSCYQSCYQESANTTNQTGIDGSCGLNYSGSYPDTWNNGWIADFYAYDGNWSTFVGPYWDNTWQYINATYIKPANSNSTSQIKYSFYNNTAPLNFTETIPISCWNYNETWITFEIRAKRGPGGYGDLRFACYNGSGSVYTFYYRSYPAGDACYFEEEAMIWNISESYSYNYSVDLNPNITNMTRINTTFYRPNYSLVNYSLNSSQLNSGNFTFYLTQYNISPVNASVWTFNASTASENITIKMLINLSRGWYDFKCNGTSIGTSNTNLFNLSVGQSRLFNCTLDLLNASQSYVNWSKTEDNMSFNFNYSFG